MNSNHRFHRLMVVGLALFPMFAIAVSAQPGTRRSTEATRRAIANDTFRELMKRERETLAGPTPRSEAEKFAALKQVREDFREIQDVNNKMMSQAWARESIDYEQTSNMLGEINDRAVRLKSNLALPQPDKTQHKNLTANGVKEFKSALLLMDRSLMSFVNNPVFRERNVVEVNLAAQATRDLDDVIAYSTNLRKIAANLKRSKANQ
ncbi:MAG TPA: hypothetical protein VIU65_03655 [Pyrinomonadaceae bacterium]